MIFYPKKKGATIVIIRFHFSLKVGIDLKIQNIFSIIRFSDLVIDLKGINRIVHNAKMVRIRNNKQPKLNVIALNLAL